MILDITLSHNILEVKHEDINYKHVDPKWLLLWAYSKVSLMELNYKHVDAKLS